MDGGPVIIQTHGTSKNDVMNSPGRSINKSVSASDLDLYANTNDIPITSTDQALTLKEHDNSYSADVKPLALKANPQHNDGSIAQSCVQHQSSLSRIRRSLKRSSLSRKNHILDRNSLFDSLDVDHFERYLKRPQHIKVFRRGGDLKQFNRLVLAQELKLTDIPDAKNEINHLFTESSTLSSTTMATVTSQNSHGLSANGSRPLDSSSRRGTNNLPTSKAIWVTKFSSDGKFMSTAGKDGVLRVWKVISSPVERWELNGIEELNKLVISRRAKRKHRRSIGISPVPSASAYAVSDNASIASVSSSGTMNSTTSSAKSGSTIGSSHSDTERDNSLSLSTPIFHPRPYKVFNEHAHDILDSDWSKNNFILTASMDKTVKLWHPNRRKSLKTFNHPDFVTSVIFHPTDDRFFISGCLDQRCRLWSILDNDVVFEFNCQDLITSMAISEEEGQYTVVGTFNGYIHILFTRGLQHVATFHVMDKQNKSSNKDFNMESFATDSSMTTGISNKLHYGPRVTGLQIYKDATDPDGEPFRILATSSDSRIRVFKLQNRKYIEFLKGFHSSSSNHRARMSMWHNEPIVISSSDNHWIYAWKLKSMYNYDTNSNDHRNEEISSKAESEGSGIRRSGSFRNFLRRSLSRSSGDDHHHHHSYHHHLHLSHLIPTSSSYERRRALKNKAYNAIHAHHAPVTTAVLAPLGTSKTLSLSNDILYELTLESFKEMYDDATTAAADTSSVIMSRVLNAVGTILVSTDNTGNIRVFRSDIPFAVRKIVLSKLKHYKESHDEDTMYTSMLSPGTPATANTATTTFSHNNDNDYMTLDEVEARKKIACDVCSGTNTVTTTTKNNNDKKSVILCKDCGSILNEFR